MALSMIISFPLLTTIAVCLAEAAIEGVAAGKNVRPFFASLRFPRGSAPLWVWSLIGAGYYLVFGFILYRVIGFSDPGAIRTTTVALIIAMMTLNGLSNLVIFRARDLRLAFYIGAAFPLFDVALLLLLLKTDRLAAAALMPYLVYRVYAVWWGHALWKANPPETLR
jgi:tryptophan-rich sensory protein